MQHNSKSSPHLAIADLPQQFQTHDYSDLNHLSILAVSGPDAQTFLQGQLTCDMREVNTQRGTLGAYCNNKGRVIANFHIVAQAEDGSDYLLLLHKDVVAVMLERLRKFAIFSKVALNDVSDKYSLLGGINAVIEDASNAIELSGALSRWVYLLEDGSSAYAEDDVGEKAEDETVADNTGWLLLDILCGVPLINAATSEKFTPHAINLQLLDAVSFKKGCYVGQEVVARMHHLGKLKQHMYHCTVTSSSAPQPGSAVYASADESKRQTVGTVVNCMSDCDGHYHLLVTLQDKYAQDGLCQLADDEAAVLKLASLPYSLTDA